MRLTPEGGERLSNQSPDDHTFVPVHAQSGCARCGYARGQHPTSQHLRQRAQWFDRHRAADPHCTCNDCIEYHASRME